MKEKFKPEEFTFEILDQELMDEFHDGAIIVGLGTADGDDDIRDDSIDHPDFSKYFVDMCENVFELTEEGQEKFKSREAVAEWCKSIGMKET